MDVVILIIIIIVSLAMLFSSFYLITWYSHPDEKGFASSLFTKLIIVLGIFLTWCSVLKLPLDVSNSRNSSLNLEMDVFWLTLYLSLLVMSLLVFPIMYWWYECDEDDSTCDKIKHVSFYILSTLFVIFTLLIISYSFLKTVIL